MIHIKYDESNDTEHQRMLNELTDSIEVPLSSVIIRRTSDGVPFHAFIPATLEACVSVQGRIQIDFPIYFTDKMFLIKIR